MYDVGLFALQELVEFRTRVTGPNRSLRNANLTQNVELTDLVIAPREGDDAVVGPLQHSLFLIEDNILATRLLICIVN